MPLLDIEKINKLPLDKQIKKKIEVIESNDLLNIPSFILPDVFVEEYCCISYSHRDYKEVYKDIFALQTHHINTWYDKGMPLGKSWKDSANKYMVPRSCLGVLFYISENSLKSKAVFEELEYAYLNGKARINIVIPFTSDYIYQGESVKGKIFSPLTMYQILKENNQITYEADDELIKKFFDDNILFQRIDTPIETRVHQIHNTLVLKPLLEMERLKGLDERLVIRYGYDEDDNAEFDEEIVFSINDITDTNVIEVKEEDFFQDNFYSPFDEEMTFLVLSPSIFAHCSFLEKVTFPKRTYQILGNGAFFGDKNLQYIINGYIGDVGDETFYNCIKLIDIGDSELIKVGTYAFMNCYNLTSDIKMQETSIGHYAFYNCHKLKSVTIPETNPLYSKNEFFIGKSAFSNCYSLEEITIPNNCISIDSKAFSHCHKMKSIYIPTRVEKIADDAFDYCYSLEEIIVDKNNKTYKSIDGVLYTKDGKELIKIPALLKVDKIYIDEKVVYINDGSFLDIDKKIDFEISNDNNEYKSIDGSIYRKDGTTLIYLKKDEQLVIPENVKDIQYFALSSFKDVKTINIPEHVNYVQNDAFGSFTHIDELNIYGATYLAVKAFPKDIVINTINFYNSDISGQILPHCHRANLLSDNINLRGSLGISTDELNIANNVVEIIGTPAFIRAEKVYIGDKAQSIKHLFTENDVLKEINLSSNNHHFIIKDNMLLSSDLKTLNVVIDKTIKVDIPQTIEIIMGGAFYNYQADELILPDSVIEIRRKGIVGEIKNIVLSDNITYIGTDGVDIYHHDKYIPSKTNPHFYLMDNGYPESRRIPIHKDTKIINRLYLNDDLETYTLQEGVIYVDYFKGGESITELVLPSSLKHLYYFNIENLHHLKTIIFNGGEERWNEITSEKTREKILYNCKVIFKK